MGLGLEAQLSDRVTSSMCRALSPISAPETKQLLLVSLQPKMSSSAGDFIRWGRKNNIEDKIAEPGLVAGSGPNPSSPEVEAEASLGCAKPHLNNQPIYL